jgi:hypothetical protein
VLTDSIANYLHGVDEPEVRSRTGLVHSKSALDIQNKGGQTNQARKNIKTNTKQLKGEINSIEQQIAELQDTILGTSFAGVDHGNENEMT